MTEDDIFKMKADDISTNSQSEEDGLKLVEDSSADEPEIYGLDESAVSTSEPVSPVLNRNKGRGDESDEHEACSLEEIYERKRREKLQRDLSGEEDELQPMDHEELPRHPFFDRLFTPLFMPGVMLRILMMIGIGVVPFSLAVRLFGNLLSRHYLENGYRLNNFFLCLYEDKVILFIFCFLWGVFSIPYVLHVFDATADGDDRINEWPEYNFIGGLGQFLWLVILLLIAGIPGWILGRLFGFPIMGLVVSAMFFIPIFFLSCMESDTLFTLLTKRIVISVKDLWKSWLLFYIWSFAFFLLTVMSSVFSLWMVGGQTPPTFMETLVVALAISTISSILPVAYLRVLGRLAWIVADWQRRRQETNEQNAESDNDSIIDILEEYSTK